MVATTDTPNRDLRQDGTLYQSERPPVSSRACVIDCGGDSIIRLASNKERATLFRIVLLAALRAVGDSE